MSAQRRILRASIAARRPSLSGFASSDDIDLVFQDAPASDSECALIHVADFERERAIYTLHSPGGLQAALDAPFLYAAALDHAIGALSVPFERAGEMAPAAAARPCFIYCLGRTGSTLLVKLLRAAGYAAVSEPDLFTQLCCLNAAARMRLGPDMLRALVAAGIASLAAALAPSESDASVFVKLRSHCNAGADLLAGALPASRTVLMLRHRRPWSLARSRAFGEPPERIAGILAEGLAAFDALARHGNTPLVIWYEELVADPIAVLRLLAPDGIFDAAAIGEVMRRDAHAGTALARRPATADGEDTAAFDRAWAQAKHAGPAWSSEALALMARLEA